MNPQTLRPLVAMLLLMSAVVLALRMPGGPLETRHFTQLDPARLAAYKVFLTGLGAGSLVLTYFVFKGRRRVLSIAAACGSVYCLVYAFDVAGVFPRSREPVAMVLRALEWLGLGLAAPLSAAALRASSVALPAADDEIYQPPRVPPRLATLAFAVGLGLLIFAAVAALRG